MTKAKTMTQVEIEQLLLHISTHKYAARNRSMMLLTRCAGLRIGEVAGMRWSDVTTTDGQVKDAIRLLPDMTKGRHARTVFVSAKLKADLQAYAEQTTFVDRSYPFFASQKSIKLGSNAISLAQTFAMIYKGAGLEGANSHSGSRTVLTHLANQGISIHLLKRLTGHRSISTTAPYLYSSPNLIKAAVELG
jgi:integrase/recombinase XerD